MNSLKNTIVAVGLLGLSFAFYQFSEKKPTVNSELISPIAQAEPGVELSQPSSLKASPKRATADPSLSVELPKNPFPEIANPSTDHRKEVSTPDFTAPPLQPRKQAAPLTLQPRPTPKTTPLEPVPSGRAKSDFARSDFAQSDSNAFPAGGATAIDPVQRDRGLIDALKNNQTESNGFEVADSTTSSGDMVRPPFGDDNSFNQKANGFEPLEAKPAPVQPDEMSQNRNEPLQVNFDQLGFREAWPVVEELVSREQYKDALKLLTRFYQQETLTGPQHQRLEGWLDALAAKVVFSMEHHLHKAYLTRGETLDQLATQWKVPAELIYNVNRSAIANPQQIPAGTELKKISGPFRAEINSKTGVMTLFVDDLYAVRFGVRIGISGNPRPGQFGVMMKSAEGMNWIDADKNVYPPSSPLNGYGPYFLGLEGELCIHAIGDDKQTGHYGCFGLVGKDAKDVFEILTTDSMVTVK